MILTNPKSAANIKMSDTDIKMIFRVFVEFLCKPNIPYPRNFSIRLSFSLFHWS